MNFKNMLGLLCAASISVLSGGAFAADTVKIGALFPMSGGAVPIFAV